MPPLRIILSGVILLMMCSVNMVVFFLNNREDARFLKPRFTMSLAQYLEESNGKPIRFDRLEKISLTDEERAALEHKQAVCETGANNGTEVEKIYLNDHVGLDGESSFSCYYGPLGKLTDFSIDDAQALQQSDVCLSTDINQADDVRRQPSLTYKSMKRGGEKRYAFMCQIVPDWGSYTGG